MQVNGPGTFHLENNKLSNLTNYKLENEIIWTSRNPLKYIYGNENKMEKFDFCWLETLMIFSSYFKNLLGILGSATGKIYSHLKEHPLPLDKTKWRPIAKGVACATLLGSGVGLGIGWYRNKPLYIYPLSVGANFAFAMASFLGINKKV